MRIFHKNNDREMKQNTWIIQHAIGWMILPQNSPLHRGQFLIQYSPNTETRTLHNWSVKKNRDFWLIYQGNR